MPNAVIRKLQALGSISDQERDWLVKAVDSNTKFVCTRTDLVGEGEKPQAFNLLVSGMACRYKMLDDGRRQIVAFIVPGDFCNPPKHIVSALDYRIATLTSSEIAGIATKHIDRMLGTSLAQPIMMSASIEEATLRAWVMNVGRRHSEARTAHLICELYARLDGVGLVKNNEFDLPITQADWADALGLSLVHMNRTLRDLRLAELASVDRKKLKIFDLPGLQAVAGFKPDYLNPGSRQVNPRLFSGSSSPQPSSAPH